MKRALFVVGIIVALLVAFVVETFIIAWLHDDHLNAQRLHTLDSDGLLRCHVAQISPWTAQDEDVAGSAKAIGPSFSSPTTVSRTFYLNNADPTSVMTAFENCAQKNGWNVTQESWQVQDFSFSGSKTFPGKWSATLEFGIEKQAPSTTQPIVVFDMNTDGV